MLLPNQRKKNAFVPKWPQIPEKEKISSGLILSNQQETLVWLEYKKYMRDSRRPFLSPSFITKSSVPFKKGVKSNRPVNRGVFGVGEGRIPEWNKKWRKLELFFFLRHKWNGVWWEEKVEEILERIDDRGLLKVGGPMWELENFLKGNGLPVPLLYRILLTLIYYIQYIYFSIFYLLYYSLNQYKLSCNSSFRQISNHREKVKASVGVLRFI